MKPFLYFCFSFKIACTCTWNCLEWKLFHITFDWSILSHKSHCLYSRWITIAWGWIFVSSFKTLIVFCNSFQITWILQKDPNSWLHSLGLEMYKPNFQRNNIKSAQDMEALKSFTKNDIKEELGIRKAGKMYLSLRWTFTGIL